jgi:hypothetical protein
MLVNLQDEYDYEGLVKMLQEEDPYVLADDIAKVLIVMWNGYSIHERRRIKEWLLRYATDETIEDTIEGDEDGEDD